MLSHQLNSGHRWSSTFPRLVGLTLLCIAVTATANPIHIAVVLSDEGDNNYRQFAQAVKSGLTARQANVEIDIHSLDNHIVSIHARPALIVTIGTEAARNVAKANPSAPILHTLLSRTAAQEVLRNGRMNRNFVQRDSAIFLDQPLRRQLDLLRTALPNHKRVGLIVGPSTSYLSNELRTGARERGLKVEAVQIEQRGELLPVLENLLNNNDVLLSVTEPLAYQSETLHHVLLTTYRYKVPVMGSSKAYVDAGALMAVYSTPQQIGQQVAELLSSQVFIRDALLPVPGYPKYFTISVNRRVATSLDLQIESEKTLQAKLKALPH